MFESGVQVVPAGLEETPAGAALGALLERLDPERVSPHDTVRLVAAQRRQLAHQQARFHACAREAALADPTAPGGRAERDVPAAGDELRVVLAASRTAVARVLDLADAAVQFPRLGAAWEAGLVDEQRVAILVRWTVPLSLEHATEVIDALVDEAGGLTPSRLIDRIQALARALDPQWAEKLYRRHRQQRRVRARCTAAGTVNLSALDLPFEGAVRSTRRLNALAARVQAAGHPGLLDTIRADVILAVLHPSHAGADDDEIVAAVLAMAQPDDPRPRRRPDPDHAPPADPPPADPAPRRSTRQSRFELRVGLGTLLLLDDRPARLPGWGVVTAGTARELAASYADAEWRVAVSDGSGALVSGLLTRHRPAHCWETPQEPPVRGAPRPVVELHVTEAELDRLHPGDHPGWTRLLADLQHQLALWRAACAEDRAAREAEGRAAEQAEGRVPAPDDEPALDALGWARVAARRRRRAREALARFPSAALRRWITMRDRSCVFPPCGASALESEIDHTLAVAGHGPTRSDNLGPACRHDHDLKEHGWTLVQLRPGWFRWVSPTGHAYERPPRPVVDDVPGPRPPAGRSSTEPCEYADEGPLWVEELHRAPPAPAEGRPPSGTPPAGPASAPGPPPDDPDPPPF
ncbi:hypothetical protein GCM10023200_19890 [Actinomycetospora chlora]|uniref:HNH nuclease domain-containing protein n=1 Tax=Actinomycetospora chlora TaxID=663608 RepID=A0ABP9AU49_9PSEU